MRSKDQRDVAEEGVKASKKVNGKKGREGGRGGREDERGVAQWLSTWPKMNANVEKPLG